MTNKIILIMMLLTCLSTPAQKKEIDVYHLGICLRKVGSFIEAIKYMKKASEKGELNGWVDLELAWNFAEIGEKEAAKGYLANVEKYLNINDEGVSRDYKIVKAQIESLPTLLA